MRNYKCGIDRGNGQSNYKPTVMSLSQDNDITVGIHEKFVFIFHIKFYESFSEILRSQYLMQIHVRPHVEFTIFRDTCSRFRLQGY